MTVYLPSLSQYVRRETRANITPSFAILSHLRKYIRRHFLLREAFSSVNYFAHGIAHLDRPYFLAGTAAPDWLSVADRSVRLRPRYVRPFADGAGDPRAEFAAGVLQHMEDDDRFHRLPAFYDVSGELLLLFRRLLHPHDGFRPGFLAHIVTELLMDAVLIDRRPELLRAYYTALDSVDPHLVQQCVNEMAKNQTQRLAGLLPLFTREAFLWDYLESERLLYRLNQVMRRVKLQPLPPETAAVLDEARIIVRDRIDDLILTPIPPRTKDAPR